MKGLVVRNTGSWYIVRPDSGADDVPCKVKGNFRLKGIRTTNPVAVGDLVEFETTRPSASGPGANAAQASSPTATDVVGYITKIQPRRNYIIRRASNLSKQAHILAANLDQVVLLVTVSHPVTSTTFIDRFLATAEAYRVPALLVINKTDLLSPDEARYADDLAYLYRYVGYPVHAISVKTGDGIAGLRAALVGKTTLLSGHSGVGKSSLINVLIPSASQRTAELSESHDTGQHTTTFSEMLLMPDATSDPTESPTDAQPTYVIDTPGIKGFGTIEFSRGETSHYFPEIFRIGHDCRFSDCTHTHEPGCAVLQAVDDHRISQSRYDSYLSILGDEDESKYRESE